MAGAQDTKTAGGDEARKLGWSQHVEGLQCHLKSTNSIQLIVGSRERFWGQEQIRPWVHIQLQTCNF